MIVRDSRKMKILIEGPSKIVNGERQKADLWNCQWCELMGFYDKAWLGPLQFCLLRACQPESYRFHKRALLLRVARLPLTMSDASYGRYEGTVL